MPRASDSEGDRRDGDALLRDHEFQEAQRLALHREWAVSSSQWASSIRSQSAAYLQSVGSHMSHWAYVR